MKNFSNFSNYERILLLLSITICVKLLFNLIWFDLYVIDNDENQN